MCYIYSMLVRELKNMLAALNHDDCEVKILSFGPGGLRMDLQDVVVERGKNGMVIVLTNKKPKA